MRALRSSGPQPGGDTFDRHSYLLRCVKKEGTAYFRSNPGPHWCGKNVNLHTDIYSAMRGDKQTIEKLEDLRNQIDYRLNHVMRLATAYKNVLGIDFPDCERVSTEEIQGSQVVELMVYRAWLFDPERVRGIQYEKGVLYIAACIQHAGWNEGQAAEKLADLATFRATQGIYSLVSDGTRGNGRSTVRQVDIALEIIELEAPSNNGGLVKAKDYTKDETRDTTRDGIRDDVKDETEDEDETKFETREETKEETTEEATEETKEETTEELRN